MVYVVVPRAPPLVQKDVPCLPDVRQNANFKVRVASTRVVSVFDASFAVLPVVYQLGPSLTGLCDRMADAKRASLRHAPRIR